MAEDFLASTVRGLYLVKNNEVKKVFGGGCYGITWNKKELFLVHWNRPAVLIFDKQFKNNKIVDFQLKIEDGHQALWVNDSLYVTNTGHNKIDSWKDGEAIVYQWLPTVKNNEQAYDHINSIWYYNSNFYVCEHRRGRLPVIIRVFDEEFNEVNKYQFSNIRTDHLNGLHNVYVENEHLFTLSVNNLIVRNINSDTEEDVIFDIRSQQDIGYLRGFARNEKNFYIGESCVSVKQDRRKGDSKVIILDNDFEIEEIITIEDSGQIHDIRLLKNDKAHNMIPCPKWVDGNY